MRPLTFLVLFSFLLGCQPASPSPESDSVSTEISTLMPSTSQPSNLQPSTDDWWHPTAGLTWQWQIGDNDIDTAIEADVYDIDLYVDQALIDELHAKGRKVICYMSVGSYEDWRPDKDQFPAEVLGNDYDGWPGEKWLDCVKPKVLMPLNPTTWKSTPTTRASRLPTTTS